ncbi:MAG: ABC transporter substrate-binding protein [Candidatus Fimenecus sp.]
MKRRKLFKIFSVFFALLIFITAMLIIIRTKKRKQPKEPETKPSTIKVSIKEKQSELPLKEMALPYSEQDSINPFMATSQVHKLLFPLLYESLFVVKQDYTEEAVLAGNVVIEDGKASVELLDKSFSNGKKITGYDVAYSFRKAKTSPLYASSLANINSCDGTTSKAIFHLTHPDKYLKNVLTFPIVRAETAEERDKAPIGSGKYLFTSRTELKLSEKNSDGETLETIRLFNITDYNYVLSAIEIGNIDAYFGIGSGEFRGVGTDLSNGTVYFMGINSSNPALSNAAVRTALYYLCGRTALCERAFAGNALSCSTPFLPSFRGMNLFEEGKNIEFQKAAKILSDSGYNKKNSRGALTYGNSSLAFSILVNSDDKNAVQTARLVSEQLAAGDVKAWVTELSADKYNQALAAGAFDIYIGSVKMSDNMDLTPFYFGAASFGVDKELDCVKKYYDFLGGRVELSEYMNMFFSDMPFIPLVSLTDRLYYRSGYNFSKDYSDKFVYLDLTNTTIKNK